MEELATLRQRIKAFQTSFIEWQGRPPSSSDLEPSMRQAYARYEELKRLKLSGALRGTCSSAASVAAAAQPQQGQPRAELPLRRPVVAVA